MKKNRPNGRPKKKSASSSDTAVEEEVVEVVVATRLSKTGRATLISTRKRGRPTNAEIIRKTDIIISRCSRRMT